jgi:capsular polysaccharide biosynthesis protein
LSYRSRKDVARSRIMKVREIQEQAIANGQIARALGYRSGSPYPVLPPHLPPPTRWEKGNRVWSFG